jgi:hypothetical protein
VAFATLSAEIKVRGGGIRARTDALRNPHLVDDTLKALLDTVADTARAYARAMAARTRPLEDSVTGRNKAVANLAGLAGALADKYPACVALSLLRATAAVWVADTAGLRGAIGRAVAHADAIDSLATRLERVRSAPERTRLRTIVGRYDDPTAVELLVQRSAIGPDTVWHTIAAPRLEFGGGRRRFSISVGATASGVTSAEYEGVLRYRQPAPSQPGDTVETIVLETGRTTRQVAPVVALNMRLFEFPYRLVDALHLTVGTAPRSADSKLTLDYLLGLAFSGFDERVLFGGGLVSAEQRTLANGYTVGAAIPAGQAIPTRTSRVTRPALSLSFRVF